MPVNKEVVFDIIKASLWSQKSDGLTFTEEIRTELCKQSVDGLSIVVNHENVKEKYLRAARFAQMLTVQTSVINIIQQSGISVVVLKGTSAGIYYPFPFLRKYGDIDLLVHPNNYTKTIEILKENGYVHSGEIGKNVTTFRKNGYQIEIHQRPPGLSRVKEGSFIQNYLITGLDKIEYASISQPKNTFPMLPWQQNRLELIWHIREHLYNGLGLRQVIDWMMFVYKCLDSDESFREYSEILKNAGLEELAITVTRMCQLYLGLDNDITWCKDVDPEICRELMEYILDQGNFGIKREDDKTVKALTRYRNPFSFFVAMQKKGLAEWNPAKKCVLLKPFAWTYICIEGIHRYTGQRGVQQFLLDLKENNRRRKLFDNLYDDELEGRIGISQSRTR